MGDRDAILGVSFVLLACMDGSGITGFGVWCSAVGALNCSGIDNADI